MANQITVMRRAALIALSAGIPVSWLFASGAASALPIMPIVSHVSAPAPAKTVVAADAAEGWFAPTPVDLCTTPVGCPPQLLPSLYPANTLHIGVVLGLETARTYLKPDLQSVPPGARVLNATMTLPVATGATDGTLSPGSAAAIVCLATSSFQDGVAGSLATPPKTDCHTSAKLTYDAKRNVFTADVTPFFAAWADGQPENGVAVMADPAKTSLLSAWHVAFNEKGLPGAPHISTSVRYVPASTGSPATVTATPAPTPTDSVAPPQISLPSGGDTTAVEPPPVIAPSQPAAQPVALSTGFKYPMAFLFPIALLAVGVFLTRLFTRDATPARRR